MKANSKFPTPIAVCFASVMFATTLSASNIDSSTTTTSSNLITFPLIPHHIQRERRLGSGEDPFASKTSALYQGYGTHYVDLWVGTPPQRQTLIIDTGSSVTAFPCYDCENCGSGYHTDDYFRQQDSSSFHAMDCSSECVLGTCSGSLQCEVSVSYQEGSSWNAFEAMDVVYVGGPHDEGLKHSPDSFQFRFGCQTHLTGLFKTQLADGITGMEMSDSSLWKQAFHAGVIHSQAFSLCFSRQPVASRQGTGAGVLTLGGSDTRLHSTTMVFADQPHSNGWFTVHIRAIYLRRGGGESVLSNNDKARIERLAGVTEDQINSGEVILDSGTTDTYLSMNLAAPFRNAYKALMDGLDWDPDNSVSLTTEELLDLPTILIQLSGAGEGTGTLIDDMAQGLAGALDTDHPYDILVAVPPTHYMEYSSKTQDYTPRFYFTESYGGVLGANFLMGHEVFFDVENQNVGFAESDCNYLVVSDVKDSDRD